MNFREKHDRLLKKRLDVLGKCPIILKDTPKVNGVKG